MAWRKPASVNEWLDIVFRHKKKFFFAAAPIAVTVFVFSHYVPRQYTARTELEIEKDLVTVLTRSPTMDNLVRPLRDLLVQDIKSRSAAEKVFHDLSLDRDLSHHVDGTLTPAGQITKSEIVDKIRENIGVTFLARTEEVDRFIISYTDEDRSLAPEIVNRLADNYVRQTFEKFNRDLSATRNFFEKNATEVRTVLREKELELIRFNQDNPGLDPNQPGNVETELLDRRSRLTALEDQRVQVREQIRAQEAWIRLQSPLIQVTQEVPNPELQSLQNRKTLAEEELFAEQSKPGQPTDIHPTIRRLKDKIALLDAEIAQKQGTVTVVTEQQPNTPLFDAENQVRTWSGELVGLDKLAEQLKNEINALEMRNAQFAQLRETSIRLQRDIAENTTLLEQWEGKFRQAQLAMDAQVGGRSLSVTVKEPAEPSIKPSSPTMAKILMAALVLGVGAGALMILLAEVIDHSFRNVQHAVDDLKLPVLGAVNEIRSPAEMFRRKVLGWGVYPAVAGIVVVVLAVSIYLANLSLTNPERYDQLTHDPMTGLTGK